MGGRHSAWMVLTQASPGRKEPANRQPGRQGKAKRWARRQRGTICQAPRRRVIRRRVGVAASRFSLGRQAKPELDSCGRMWRERREGGVCDYEEGEEKRKRRGRRVGINMYVRKCVCASVVVKVDLERMQMRDNNRKTDMIEWQKRRIKEGAFHSIARFMRTPRQRQKEDSYLTYPCVRFQKALWFCLLEMPWCKPCVSEHHAA